MDLSKLPGNIKIEATVDQLKVFAQTLLEEYVQRLGDAEINKAEEIEAPCNAQEIAEYLDVTRQHIYWMTSKRRIPFIRRGRRVYFLKSQVKAWLEERQQKTYKDLEAQAQEYLEQDRKKVKS